MFFQVKSRSSLVKYLTIGFGFFPRYTLMLGLISHQPTSLLLLQILNSVPQDTLLPFNTR